MPELNDTLSARGSRYGDFSDNAAISNAFLTVAMGNVLGGPATNWHLLDPVKKQGLILIFQKLARALSPTGDPDYTDNWHDIQGYAKLIEDRCQGMDNFISNLAKGHLDGTA